MTQLILFCREAAREFVHHSRGICRLDSIDASVRSRSVISGPEIKALNDPHTRDNCSTTRTPRNRRLLIYPENPRRKCSSSSVP
jgi:hypothetical protein